MSLAACSALSLQETTILRRTLSFAVNHAETVNKGFGLLHQVAILFPLRKGPLAFPPKSACQTAAICASGKLFTLVLIFCLISKTTTYLLPAVFSAETRPATSHLSEGLPWGFSDPLVDSQSQKDAHKLCK